MHPTETATENERVFPVDGKIQIFFSSLAFTPLNLSSLFAFQKSFIHNMETTHVNVQLLFRHSTAVLHTVQYMKAGTGIFMLNRCF